MLMNENNKITIARALFYTLVQSLLFYTHIGFYNVLPNLYFFLMGIIKPYLEQEAKPADLFIACYCDNYFLFYATALLCILIALCVCYYTNARNDNRHFVRRLICIGVPLNIALTCISATIFLIMYAVLALYFGAQLLPLQQTPLAITLSNPVDSLFSIIHTINPLTIIPRLQTLQTATQLFEQINTASYYMYFLSQYATVVVSVIFGFKLRGSFRNLP